MKSPRLKCRGFFFSHETSFTSALKSGVFRSKIKHEFIIRIRLTTLQRIVDLCLSDIINQMAGLQERELPFVGEVISRVQKVHNLRKDYLRGLPGVRGSGISVRINENPLETL